jgi:hypothetical protein
MDGHYDGNRGARLLDRHDRTITPYNDDGDLEANELHGQIRQSVHPPARVSQLNDDIPALDITQLSQLTPKGGHPCLVDLG